MAPPPESGSKRTGAANRILTVAVLVLLAVVVMDRLNLRTSNSGSFENQVLSHQARQSENVRKKFREQSAAVTTEEDPASEPVVPAATPAPVVNVRPESQWATDPAITSVTMPPDTKFVIIEVGTNVNPDYMNLISSTPGAFLIGMEPVVTDEAVRTCRHRGHGKCTILPMAVGPKEAVMKMNVARASVCSTLLPLPDPNADCNKFASAKDVKVVRLDTLIAYAVPAELPIKYLMLDMQGFDLYGAASLTVQPFIKKRVANFLLECQDLPVGDRNFLSPGAKSCGECVSCITKHWGYKFIGCTPNMGPYEYNCMFANTDHPLHDPNLRHTFKAEVTPSTEVKYPAECPAMFTNPDVIENPPPPTKPPTKPPRIAPSTRSYSAGADAPSTWAQDSDVVGFKIPSDVTEVVIEVGTNKNPDYLGYAQSRPSVFLLGMEPVVHSMAVGACSGNPKCAILPIAVGPKEAVMKMNVARISECSTLLPLPDPNADCNKLSSTIDVKVVRLDTLVRYAIPENLPISILALDMQGYDLYGASSLTDRNTIEKRVANFVMECQDLPVGDSRFLSPGAKSCGECVSCITQHWGYKFIGCTPNMGPFEMNCMFVNTAHPLHNPNFRPSFNGHMTPSTEVKHPAECPTDMFLDGRGASSKAGKGDLASKIEQLESELRKLKEKM